MPSGEWVFWEQLAEGDVDNDSELMGSTETFVGVILPQEMPTLPTDWIEIAQEAAEDDPSAGDRSR